MSATFDRTWMWHPSFSEDIPDTAGLFVHFRRQFSIDSGTVPKSLKIHITADTKYKLYVNHELVAFGPVKGDHNLWFYDELDIVPYLKEGDNYVGVHVLRFFYSTQYAPAFPRLPTGGLRITLPENTAPWREQLSSSDLWETAIDPISRLRVDEPEDVFLHIYESHGIEGSNRTFQWVPAQVLRFKNSTGNSTPWHLSPRLIPPYRITAGPGFTGIHNLKSNLPIDTWRAFLLGDEHDTPVQRRLHLEPGSRHELELEVAHHTTAFIRACFARPSERGGYIKITYAESYEDEPDYYKGERKKAHRRDRTKQLFGPHDIYHFQGVDGFNGLEYYDETKNEIFAPFHFRTFRFIKVEILAGTSVLDFRGLDIQTTHYPLEVRALFSATRGPSYSTSAAAVNDLWNTSIRTLVNCMHDCYEDCPFYEQMQYAMDTRSSAIFTYCISGDDRLARQAIIQLYNSFQPRIGLTASRAPTHRQQFIPHFSLYWICMLCDHYDYYGDEGFLSQFMPVADSILTYFESRVDSGLHLVKLQFGPDTGTWHFIDWTKEWKPYGYPSVFERTGFSTYTNAIYAYTLNAISALISALGRPTLGDEYRERAKRIASSLRQHCFDGNFFTDSLVTAYSEHKTPVYSQHSQVWAVLSGAISGEEAQTLLRKSAERTDAGQFIQESVAMSFYTLRAFSLAGGHVYDDHFHQFWKPWYDQLALGVTTWVEDAVAQRSDCHAWGSVPLYEFIAEVAGVRPDRPGWKAIRFQPRLGLYSRLSATVPVNTVGDETLGAIHISWTGFDAGVKVVVRGEKMVSRPIPLHIILPNQDLHLDWTGHQLEFMTSA
ncbi:bacterial alpha-L-rhamnosidase-domain-containing protein [Fusarium flagelliforme]|uniref:bacterial alpha-L-rhamnosidase-domain-containing protein n=1 Tax=Fusarium flagelliforme TaxID=2675880 RepID=UPI001E8D66D8|nr:bacterial alpha-L-rhamnosidase-domain-containing protein [Fusarium flagelliforme]KAH7174195.1 bacterial alpha-L-rhamnosidase-domain-containing protein [Fusarium flagelliforme]